MIRLLRGRRVLIGLFVVAALLLSGFVYGQVHYSKGRVLDRYLAARQKEGDVLSHIKPYLVWSDTKEYITLDEGRPANFSQLTKEEAAELKQQVLAAKEGDPIYLTKIGRKWWVFPDYRLALAPISLTLKTNVPGVNLLLNEKRVGTSDSDNYELRLDRLPYSTYTASLSGQYEGKTIAVSKPYDGVKPVIDLAVSFKTFSVTSNMADATLYFGEDRIGQLSDGSYQVEDYPIAQDTQVYVGKKFSDGDVLSKKVSLADVKAGETLVLDIDGLLTEDEAAGLVLSVFDRLLEAYLYGQDSQTLKDTVEGGADNPFYQLLKTSIKSKTQTDSRRASSLGIQNVYLASLNQVGKESYLVNFGAQYDFYYDKSTDTSKHSQGHLYQNVAGSFTLIKSGDRYLIAKDKAYGLDLVSEDNQIKIPAQLKTSSGLPSGLAGTWESRVPNLDATAYMTISSSGQVETIIAYDDETQKDLTLKASLSSYKTVSSGLYVLGGSGDSQAWFLGGLGGVGIKYAMGMRVSGTTLTTIIWSVPVADDFDYDVYGEGVTWTKSKGRPAASTSKAETEETPASEDETVADEKATATSPASETGEAEQD